MFMRFFGSAVGHKSTHDYTAALQEDAREMVKQLTAARIAEEQVYDSREAQLTEKDESFVMK